MRIYWLSWISRDIFLGYELHWPWWTSGHGDGFKTICAVIYAPDEDAVREVVYECYDVRPDHIEFRFIEDIPDVFTYTDRFPWRSWMPRFDEKFDPVALTKTQAEASARTKEAYASVLAIRKKDEEVQAMQSRVVLLDDALSIAASAVSGINVGEDDVRALKGYRTMVERPLNDYDHGFFVVSGDTEGKVYLKTETHDYYDLEGVAVFNLSGEHPIMPVRFSF